MYTRARTNAMQYIGLFVHQVLALQSQPWGLDRTLDDIPGNIHTLTPIVSPARKAEKWTTISLYHSSIIIMVIRNTNYQLLLRQVLLASVRPGQSSISVSEVQPTKRRASQCIANCAASVSGNPSPPKKTFVGVSYTYGPHFAQKTPPARHADLFSLMNIENAPRFVIRGICIGSGYIGCN
jgi:hypothetical protein